MRAARQAEDEAQASLLCCICGHWPGPFRPLPPPAPSVLAWDGGIAVQLASRIYEERDFSPASTGVLGDALEEAGLTDQELLEHLRWPGPHVRGCFVVDLLLGKS